MISWRKSDIALLQSIYKALNPPAVSRYQVCAITTYKLRSDASFLIRLAETLKCLQTNQITELRPGSRDWFHEVARRYSLEILPPEKVEVKPPTSYARLVLGEFPEEDEKAERARRVGRPLKMRASE